MNSADVFIGPSASSWTLGCVQRMTNLRESCEQAAYQHHPATILQRPENGVDLAVSWRNDPPSRFQRRVYQQRQRTPGGSARPFQYAGRERIVATVLTYEVFCRLCDVLENKQLGVDHVTLGGIASVIGAARLLGLAHGQIVEAINLTVTPYVALNQTRVENVSKWKACGYANANRNAVLQPSLRARMTGPAPAFEGRDAFFRVVSRKPFELPPFGGDGRPFKIME
jgi:hypothetical protein